MTTNIIIAATVVLISLGILVCIGLFAGEPSTVQVWAKAKIERDRMYLISQALKEGWKADEINQMIDQLKKIK